MQESEPDEQFEATDYDEEGNIKLQPPPIEAAKPKRPTVAGLEKKLDGLKTDIEEGVLGWLGQLDARLDQLEHELKPQSEQGAKFVWDKLDNQDAAIGALATALRSHIEESTAQQPKPQQEIEFAQPPTQADREQNMSYDIMTMAGMCQHMTDVLMICRVLKEAPDIPDTKKNDILHIACQNAGIDLTGGLQIRAGVKFTGA